ncbi:hypothetical protein [Polynucleobacter sp. MWH-Braz-FAM2G]|uniref:hypothetical protein n=1 Tax=Polynucleobacter sp. MWH-Braz-FAM2G TaxID=1855883 RepID=UPI001BFEE7F4|nr:hypothetical protein [Polynucleobacter sp. MWH-Braz-FAM2G]QWD90758.1 hypothetical protein FD973_10930 [Polynucleobacter sp. MWH-Braz-FAM2G]
MRNDEQVANKWLKQNGIAVKHMEKMDLCLQQAQMVATNLLTHHANWLNSEQRNLLTTYKKNIHIRARQNKACRAMAYKVLNLGKQLNRQLFRQHKVSNTNTDKSLCNKGQKHEVEYNG